MGSLKDSVDALTIDDLMRMQEGLEEGLPRKRRRLATQPAEQSDEEPLWDSTSDEGVENSGELDKSLGSMSFVRLREDVPRRKAGFAFRPINAAVNLDDCAGEGSHRKNTAAASHINDTGLKSFVSLGVSPQFEAALNKMSIRHPTEIQAACIPPLLAGRDCVGNAKTGSGKTIAFALPILQKLAEDPCGIFALVLTPTRELAVQISDQFLVLGASLNIRTAVIIGGMDMIAQALVLDNGPHVVVATPGRLVDLLRSSIGNACLSRIKFLVLDEADRLLTSTFSNELDYLFKMLPTNRQTCLFTATLTPSIEAVAAAPPRPGKERPLVHRMTALTETVDTLQQSYILVPSHVRELYLFHLLTNPPESTLPLRRAPPELSRNRQSKRTASRKSVENADILEQPPPTIIFCTKPRTAAFLTHFLKTLAIRCTALHSRLTQRERLNSLQLFRSSVIPVLVSTDVGARGLDIEDVAMVINWDIPAGLEEYTHRVGRTARAGKGGVAVSFVTERDEDRILKIEDRIGTQLTEMSLPEHKMLDKLNVVSTAKRLANMELYDSDFGKRENIHRLKKSYVTEETS